MLDPTPLWDFNDPAASEARLREALSEARSDAPGDDAAVLTTQVARALGLQGQYAEGHALLDTVSSQTPEVVVRVALERGRLLRSSGQPAEARPVFEQAAEGARAAGLDALHVDALHMVALVAAPDEQIAMGHAAIEIARASSDQRARDWESSLLNNVGMAHADAGDFVAALADFTAALACVPAGQVTKERVARWMVGWALRNLDRRDGALAMQLALSADLESTGDTDPYVDEEIALLTAR